MPLESCDVKLKASEADSHSHSHSRVRGFALKFYTTEGNFDMVGNNTPVFFMRDPLKFQHFMTKVWPHGDYPLIDVGKLTNSYSKDGAMRMHNVSDPVPVLDDAARDRLAHNIIRHVSKGVKEPVLSRVFEYSRNVDADLAKLVEEGVRANLGQ